MMHGIAARFLIVVASAYTAGLQLFSPTSLAYQAAGNSDILDALNIGVMALVAVAASDLIWHDILKRGLVFPSFPYRARHQICVAVYSSLAAMFGIRAFMATGNPGAVFQVGIYYVCFAAGIAAEALALALENRGEKCQQESSKD